MIIVKNRELLIPNNERYIGTTYDTETENRIFQVPRYSQRGVDLAALTFRLDIQYANESYDTIVLDKEVVEAFVILIWRITSATLQVPGTMYIGIRAVDNEAAVKWSSFSAAMYVERHLNTPGNYGGSLTEIEQMEQDHQYMKGVVDELKANLDYAHDAEAWAVGKRSGTDVPSTDLTYHNNSKYYAAQANSSKTAAANSAAQAAETVADTNTRFNNAMAAVTSETEVIDARVGADSTIYPVLKNRLDAEHNLIKDFAYGESSALLQSLIRNYIDQAKLIDGYYSHGDPSNIRSGTSTKYAKPIRIYAGVPYTFKNVFGYFSCIKYDDGTIYNLSDSASPNTVTVSVTPAQNGYAYITINNANYTSAMVVGGQDNYAGAVFRGYYGILNTFPYDHVIPSNYADVLPTMASAKANTVYRITSTSDMTVSGTMTDVPTELTLSSTSSMLVTIGGNETVLTFQLLITERGNAYIRRYYRNSSQVSVWSAWEPLHNVVEKITPSNYQTALPDWKTAGNGSLYQIISTASMASGNWADVPSPLKEAQCISILQTFGDPTASGCMQICTVANRGEIYTRWLNNISGTLTWTNWASNKTGRSAAIIVDAAGNGDYTSFTEAVKYAAELQDAYVLVMPGTYDIIAEYKALYGNDFFDNYDASTRDDGIVLKNGITVEFSPNAYLVCNYTGSNAVMQQKFSPLVSGVNGFTLIGCNLTSRKVRYSMHDERRTNTDYYHNRYVGCHFNHDKGDGAGYIQALGGGLGKNGFVEIENCIFENPSSTGSILSYHNSEADGARSQVIIKDSFVKGSIKFSWYGPSTLVSTMMITGCKMYADPVMTSTKPSYDVQNVEILAWNNVIQAP